MRKRDGKHRGKTANAGGTVHRNHAHIRVHLGRQLFLEGRHEPPGRGRKPRLPRPRVAKAIAVFKFGYGPALVRWKPTKPKTDELPPLDETKRCRLLELRPQRCGGVTAVNRQHE
jgi:hypothetical protein